ncbi:hypothetical protein EDD21DRAFT_376047 [Dissophora ornata]|nr:hypothetical protein BGZ58_010372 [Dissophora ornata]KAI8600851.1 hypothetical protein EDD21DRAFT_376047 [Dissophora ornata]
MSLARRTNPLEIPEVLCIIGYYLPIADQKTCMLVSRTWHGLFCSYFWHHLYYNRSGIPHLEKYGHLVRSLTMFWAVDSDLITIAGSCHTVLRLNLELTRNATNNALEILMGSMPHIQDLSLRVPCHFELTHLTAITRLKQLQRLYLGAPNGYQNSECDFAALLSVLQGCPSLNSLQMDGLLEKTDYIPERRYAFVRRVSPPPQAPTPRRWFQRLNQFRNPEPWRKFVPDVIVQIPEKIPEEPQRRQLDASYVFPKMTRLYLTNITTAQQLTTPITFLFKMTPQLQELHIDFRYLTREHASQCLDAITDSCFQIRTLAVEGLKPDSGPSIQRFFEQHRPSLRHLELKRCGGVEQAVESIPTATVAGLERVCFDSAVYSHPIFHRFMTRCCSLQHLTWVNDTLKTPPPESRIDAFLEPWACYETMRHVEQNNFIEGEDCFEAFFGRLALMERLVSLGVSVEDVRRSIAGPATPRAEGWNQEEGDEPFLDRSQEQETQQLGDDALNRSRARAEDEHVGHLRGWRTLKSVQELTIAPIYDVWPAFRPRTLPLNMIEVRCILNTFPGLRKICYKGKNFPLSKGALEYLETLKDRHISVIHISQLPPSVL